MTDISSILDQTILGRRVHRRQYRKRDGRDLFLYGQEAHILPAFEEDEGDIAKGGELRWHPLRSEWAIYAAHRQSRTFKPSTANDPLSPSKPGEPPTEIPFEQFDMAVFENKFTSLHEEAPLPKRISNLRSDRAVGRCEVVVYTPESQGSLFSIGQERRRLLLAAWIDRYEALFQKGCQFILPFENRGDEVGVTLHHPHGQIYGFPFVPNVQQRAVDAFSQGYDLAADLASFKSGYEIAAAGGMTAFCPPFARYPFEVWIAPLDRMPGPWGFNEEELDGFAHLLGEVCRRYDAYFQRITPYMMSLQAAPAGTSDTFHFTTQFYPLLRAPDRVKYLASVEQSTGAFTVDVMPERASEILRAQ